MNERFIAVIVRLRGLGYVVACVSRDRISLSREGGNWQQMMHAVRWIKQFAKNRGKVCRAYLKETEARSTYCNATQYGIDVVTE